MKLTKNIRTTGLAATLLALSSCSPPILQGDPNNYPNLPSCDTPYNQLTQIQLDSTEANYEKYCVATSINDPMLTDCRRSGSILYLCETEDGRLSRKPYE